MIIKTAMSLACAAACLATIATTPAANAEVARRSVVVKHPPIVNPGDVSASLSARQNMIESRIRAVAGDKPRFPPSADAKGVRPDYRSGTP
jgi:hypothetical protein